MCASLCRYPFLGVNNYHIEKILTIKDAGIKDGASVICGTASSNYIIPKQNPNAKYIGMYLPDKKVLDKYLSEDAYKNSYFIDSTVSEKIKKIIKEENDVYFVYTTDNMKQHNKNMKVYHDIFKQYSNDKINNLNNCKIINYSILNNYSARKEFVVCKIK